MRSLGCVWVVAHKRNAAKRYRLLPVGGIDVRYIVGSRESCSFERMEKKEDAEMSEQSVRVFHISTRLTSVIPLVFNPETA